MVDFRDLGLFGLDGHGDRLERLDLHAVRVDERNVQQRVVLGQAAREQQLARRLVDDVPAQRHDAQLNLLGKALRLDRHRHRVTGDRAVVREVLGGPAARRLVLFGRGFSLLGVLRALLGRGLGLLGVLRVLGGLGLSRSGVLRVLGGLGLSRSGVLRVLGGLGLSRSGVLRVLGGFGLSRSGVLRVLGGFGLSRSGVLRVLGGFGENRQIVADDLTLRERGQAHHAHAHHERDKKGKCPFQFLHDLLLSLHFNQFRKTD